MSRNYLVTLLVKLIIGLSRRLGFGATALPGLIAERLAPGLMGSLTRQIKGGVVLVTGTNGKTTTSKLLRELLTNNGLEVLANRSGSNFTRGILSTLIDHCDWHGRLHYDIGVLELDEAYTPHIAKQVQPRTILVLNIMRDQLDRYGEIDNTASMIASALEYSKGAVLNGDDNLVAALKNTINDDIKTTIFSAGTAIKQQLPSDAELHGEVQVKSVQSRSSQSDDVELIKVLSNNGWQDLVIKIKGRQHKLRIAFEGVHNAINATAAISVLFHLFPDFDRDKLDHLAAVKPAFGRGERIEVDGVIVHLALIKNPAGFNQNLKTFVKPGVFHTLIAINDRYADGRDVSWLWDVNYQPLVDSKSTISTSGTRSYDMALRLQYLDKKVEDTNPSIASALKQSIKQLKPGQELLVLPTYTAMLEIRKLLTKKSGNHEIWR